MMLDTDRINLLNVIFQSFLQVQFGKNLNF